MVNLRNKLNFAMLGMFLSLIIIYLYNFSSNLVVFDTLREYGNFLYLMDFNTLNEVQDFFMYLFNSVFFYVTGIDSFYIHSVGGLFFTLNSTILLYLILNQIQKKRTLSLFLSFIFLLLNFGFMGYYRPQIIALFFHLLFLFLFIKFVKSEKFNWNYFVLIIIVVLSSINVHKTTKIFPFLFSFYFFLYSLFYQRKNFIKMLILNIFSLLVILFLNLNTYLVFFSFYLGGVGSKVDKAAFVENIVSIDIFNVFFGPLFLVSFFLYLLAIYLDFKKKNIKKSTLLIDLYVLSFSLVYLGFSYILPRLDLFSANSDRFLYFLLPFYIFFIFKVHLFLKTNFSKKVLIVFLSILIISIFYVDYSDLYKVSTNKDFIDEKLPNNILQEKDIIISSFTSGAVLEIKFNNETFKNKENYYILSGYNHWGANNDQLPNLRKIFIYLGKESNIEGICDLFNNEISFIGDIPLLPEFYTLSQSEKNKVLDMLNSPGRIIIINNLNDKELKSDYFSSYEDTSWWSYRTIIGGDLENLKKNFDYQELYFSENLEIIELEFDLNEECKYE